MMFFMRNRKVIFAIAITTILWGIVFIMLLQHDTALIRDAFDEGFDCAEELVKARYEH